MRKSVFIDEHKGGSKEFVDLKGFVDLKRYRGRLSINVWWQLKVQKEDCFVSHSKLYEMNQESDAPPDF